MREEVILDKITTAIRYILHSIFYPYVNIAEASFSFIGSTLSFAIIIAQFVCLVLLVVSITKSIKELKENSEDGK